MKDLDLEFTEEETQICTKTIQYNTIQYNTVEKKSFMKE